MSIESYGLKISLLDYDVNSATPEQCSVDSHYDSFKIAFDAPSPLEGNITVNIPNDLNINTTYPILAINTNYNYIPAFYLFYDNVSSTTINPLNGEVGTIFDLDELGICYFQAVVQPLQIVFQLVIGSTYDSYITGGTYAFRYYVFAEDGI